MISFPATAEKGRNVIIDLVRGDILSSPYIHIAFAVNAEGHNDAGFAGLVANRFWPDLRSTGKKELGSVLSINANGRAFHALVCHELEGSGWERTPELVQECLDKLSTPIVSIVMIGGGLVGSISGADVFAILGGMARSKKQVAVYTL